MSQWKIYAYGNCDTCRKALRFLDVNKVKYETIDITKTPPRLDELKAMLAAVDGQIKKLFNTSGQVYREQKIGDRFPELSDDEALKLLAANGRLVKRPFALHAKGGLVGFKETEWKKALS